MKKQNNDRLRDFADRFEQLGNQYPKVKLRRRLRNGETDHKYGPAVVFVNDFGDPEGVRRFRQLVAEGGIALEQLGEAAFILVPELIADESFLPAKVEGDWVGEQWINGAGYAIAAALRTAESLADEDEGDDTSDKTIIRSEDDEDDDAAKITKRNGLDRISAARLARELKRRAVDDEAIVQLYRSEGNFRAAARKAKELYPGEPLSKTSIQRIVERFENPST